MKAYSIIALLGCLVSAPSWSAAPYTLSKSIPLGAPERWDYAIYSPDEGRLYVAHGDRVDVIDGRSGAVIGAIKDIPGGTHGTAISIATGTGITDDGKNGQAIAFDLKTLAITHRIPADDDADSITIDKATGHVFVIEGDPGTITVIDPKTATAVATIAGGEKMEYAVSDGQGSVFVAGEEKGDLLRIDARTNAVVARWPAPGCTSPHGLALDVARHRLFMGCTNSVMMVVDAVSGRVVTQLPIGKGSDAVAYDPIRKRVFSSNGGSGTVTVYQQHSANRYAALDSVPTAISGRTMALDPASGRLFVVAADTDPNPTPGGRPKARPGTLKVMFLDPIQ